MTHLDAHYNVITDQISECMECHSFFAGIPIGFIYDDPAAGWRQSYENDYIVGYCKPCATTLDTFDQADRRSGGWNARDMEDERAAA